MTTSTRCEGCGAEIVFVGPKRHPCDAEVLTVVTEPDGKVFKARRSHWGTCPEAQRFKRKPAGGKLLDDAKRPNGDGNP